MILAVFLLVGGVFVVARRTAPDATAAREQTPIGLQADEAAIGFAQDMSTHHEQAILMARSVRGRVGPEVAAVATQILESQLLESGTMRGWLSLWEAPQLPSGPPMLWMGHEHGEGHGDRTAAEGAETPPMPGMASNDELRRLEELDGPELEIWFLQLMLRHHQGGVQMAVAGRDLVQDDQASSYAAAMAIGQQNESALMVKMLSNRKAEPLPLR